MGDSYTIHKIKTFEDAHKFYEYTNPNSRWCITNGENHFNSYGLNNQNTAYFFTKDGFENVPCENGNNYPYDEYGTSMFSIIVTPERNVRAATLRWNHESGAPGDDADVSKLSEISNIDIKGVCLPDYEGSNTIDKIENAILSQNHSFDEIEKKLNVSITPYQYNEKLYVITLNDRNLIIIYSKPENKFIINWCKNIRGWRDKYVLISYYHYDELRDASLEHVIKMPGIRGRFINDGKKIEVIDGDGLTNVFNPIENKLEHPIFFSTKYTNTGLFKIYVTYNEEKELWVFAIFDENNNQIALVPYSFYKLVKFGENIFFDKTSEYDSELMLPILSTKTGYYILYRAKSPKLYQLYGKIWTIENAKPTPQYLLSFYDNGHPSLKEIDSKIFNTQYTNMPILYKVNEKTKEVTFYNGFDFDEVSHEGIYNIVLTDHSYWTLKDYLELHFERFTAIANKYGTLLTKFYHSNDLEFNKIDQNAWQYTFPDGQTFTLQKETND